MRKVKDPAIVLIGVKLPKPVADRLLAEAHRACRTRSGQVRHYVEQALAEKAGAAQ